MICIFWPLIIMKARGIDREALVIIDSMRDTIMPLRPLSSLIVDIELKVQVGEWMWTATIGAGWSSSVGPLFIKCWLRIKIGTGQDFVPSGLMTTHM
jgi:hypothetical protein